MARNKKNRPADDDGRVIAPMNVEGMPWYAPQAPREGEGGGTPEPLTGAEKRAFVFGVLKAVGLVMLAFVGVYLLFLLFCTEIWFK